jgi:lysylphosphatidylglycerol synthetase-like protein (DUF2156 family)
VRSGAPGGRRRASRLPPAPRPASNVRPVSPRALLILTRWVLPLMIAAVGGVMIAAGHANANSPAAAGGVGLIIVAVIVWMINWMFRMSVRSNEDRDQEEAARRFFDQHGRWPDE